MISLNKVYNKIYADYRIEAICLRASAYIPVKSTQGLYISSNVSCALLAITSISVELAIKLLCRSHIWGDILGCEIAAAHRYPGALSRVNIILWHGIMRCRIMLGVKGEYAQNTPQQFSANIRLSSFRTILPSLSDAFILKNFQFSKFSKSDKCPFEQNASTKQWRVLGFVSTVTGRRERQLLMASVMAFLGPIGDDSILKEPAAARNLYAFL